MSDKPDKARLVGPDYVPMEIDPLLPTGALYFIGPPPTTTQHEALKAALRRADESPIVAVERAPADWIALIDEVHARDSYRPAIERAVSRRGGLLPSVVIPALAVQYAIQDWSRFADIYAMPLPQSRALVERFAIEARRAKKARGRARRLRRYRQSHKGSK